MPMSSHTRHALKVIHDYLAGENEAVQYWFEDMADLVTQTSSGIMGASRPAASPPVTSFRIPTPPSSS
jgi:hypothetical protein